MITIIKDYETEGKLLGQIDGTQKDCILVTPRSVSPETGNAALPVFFGRPPFAFSIPASIVPIPRSDMVNDSQHEQHEDHGQDDLGCLRHGFCRSRKTTADESGTIPMWRPAGGAQFTKKAPPEENPARLATVAAGDFDNQPLLKGDSRTAARAQHARAIIHERAAKIKIGSPRK